MIRQGITNLPILKKFLSSNVDISRLYLKQKNIFDENWIEFNQSLAKVIAYIYVYLPELYKKQNLSYPKSRKFNFYMDSVVSNPSTHIFTETPRESFFDLFPVDAKKIAIFADELYKQNSIDTDEFKILFQKFYMNAFVYFDFIFDEEEEKGIFSKFQLKKELFERFKTKLNSFLEKKFSIKELCYKAPIINIDETVSFYGYDNSTKDKLQEYKHKEIYKKYISIQEELSNNIKIKHTKANKLIEFELFGYILSQKLWKFERIFQYTPEYVNYDKYNDDFNTHIISYIKDYLKIIDNYYENTDLLNKTLIEIDKLDENILNDYIFKELLKENDVIENFEITKEENNQGFIIEEKKNITKNKIENIINIMIDNNKKERFKFHRLLQSGKKEDIVDLIDLLYQEVKTKTKNQNKNFAFLGILRSGAFLAHTLNILKLYDLDQAYRSSFVITHPYISIIPRNIFKRDEQDITFIYIDEAIKSGYALGVSDIYRSRDLYLKNIKKSKDDFAVTVVDFTDFKDKIINNEEIGLRYTSLVDIVIEDKKIKPLQKKDIELTSQFNWQKFLNSFDINKNILKETIEKLSTIKINDKQRYDLDIALSDSVVLFKVVKYFYDNLIGEFDDNENIVIYAGSPQGKLLADIFIFIFKILAKKNVKFYLNVKDKEVQYLANSKLLFFDLSIVSGGTKDNCFSIDVFENLKNNKKDFDYSCTLYSKQNSDKIISIL